jgi:two-component system response regulator DevR
MVKTRDVIAPLRVMVVDDHEFIRESISRLLREEGIIVVAEEGSVRAAIDGASRFQPDVIVMDIALSDGSGIEATREIRDRNPQIRVLMLTVSEDDEALISSIMAGADGYVRKRVSGDELIAAVRAVGEGKNRVDSDTTGALMKWIRADQNAVDDQRNLASVDAEASGERHALLSAPEDRVLSLIAKGLTNKGITAEMGVSEKVVRTYVSSILGKLGIGQRRSDPAPDRGGMPHDV